MTVLLNRHQIALIEAAFGVEPDGRRHVWRTHTMWFEVRRASRPFRSTPRRRRHAVRRR